MTKTFDATSWVESKIEENIKDFGTTRLAASERISDLLWEGEYGNELSDAQVIAAYRIARRILTQG